MSRILEKRTTEAIEANLGGGTPLAATPTGPSHEAHDGVAANRDVRIHDDSGAADLSKRLGAVAFTFGRDIFLAADAPDLHSAAGERMLSHELTHVQQQRASGTTRPRRVSAPGSPAEREAARSVDTRGGPSAPAAAHTVHREVPEEEEVMTLTSETVHREVPEEEEVMTLTSETVHREVAIDDSKPRWTWPHRPRRLRPRRLRPRHGGPAVDAGPQMAQVRQRPRTRPQPPCTRPASWQSSAPSPRTSRAPGRTRSRRTGACVTPPT